MTLLDRIGTPGDLQHLDYEQLNALAAEIREFLVSSVSKTGGHLGPNLGVVELTIALHRVFDSPNDRLVFDTGHQSYVHKILTGRKDFSLLRARDGISGYPARSESEHDIVENSHASTAISWAEGIARANHLRGNRNSVVAIIGDGALTGGMAWEALNSISSEEKSRLVIVINDNGRSYEPTIGGLAYHLDALRTNRSYEKFMNWGKRTLLRGGAAGEFAFDALHGIKKGVKDFLSPQGFFEDLGIKYLGPIHGHRLDDLEFTLQCAKDYGQPILVHVLTEKGRGYQPAEDDVADRFHAVGVIHPETGLPVAPSRFGWTSVFADEIVKIAREDNRIVGITAAMLRPVGLKLLREEFPERVFDVGIAEQHAVTYAAGLAFGGMHPVFAVYSTFLNRAYDQVVMDVGLHRAPVTFVLDRAGITGDDGASHNGMWDLQMLRSVPGMRIGVPRDGERLREILREATADNTGPTAVRYPKGSLPEALPALRSETGYDILAESDCSQAPIDRRLAIIGLGPFAQLAVEVAAALREDVSHVRVFDPRWVVPHAPELI
ncbi:MAG: 1-deoxy-D-xylulose-5-phosphate synthase, partial [Bowdeniella nasicola]|nr:1-deoxy-D-xylulose-5-phosphate synthase [Bowdeniella nasicola]